VALALFVALGGVIVERLWNWLLPPLFGWRLITFWQALGILVLSRILFGNWGGGHGSPGRRMRRHMADRMAERWQHMTPEERERFRQGVRARCGVDPTPSESQGQ